LSETSIVSIMGVLGSLIGTLGGILITSKLTNYRIEQLEKKVEKHNNIVERTYILEGQVSEIQHDIRDLKK